METPNRKYSALPRALQSSNGCRPIICILHDESTFYSNADQSFHWSDDVSQALKQKSLGQTLMASDFIEVDGFLQCDGKHAQIYLEHQSDGFFNNAMFIAQVKKTTDI